MMLTSRLGGDNGAAEQRNYITPNPSGKPNNHPGNRIGHGNESAESRHHYIPPTSHPSQQRHHHTVFMVSTNNPNNNNNSGGINYFNAPKNVPAVNSTHNSAAILNHSSSSSNLSGTALYGGSISSAIYPGIREQQNRHRPQGEIARPLLSNVAIQQSTSNLVDKLSYITNGVVKETSNGSSTTVGQSSGASTSSTATQTSSIAQSPLKAFTNPKQKESSSQWPYSSYTISKPIGHYGSSANNYHHNGGNLRKPQNHSNIELAPTPSITTTKTMQNKSLADVYSSSDKKGTFNNLNSLSLKLAIAPKENDDHDRRNHAIASSRNFSGHIKKDYNPNPSSYIKTPLLSTQPSRPPAHRTPTLPNRCTETSILNASQTSTSAASSARSNATNASTTTISRVVDSSLIRTTHPHTRSTPHRTPTSPSSLLSYSPTNGLPNTIGAKELLYSRLHAKVLNPTRIVKEANSQRGALCISPKSQQAYKLTRVLQSAIYGGVFEAEVYSIPKVLKASSHAKPEPCRPKVALKIMLRNLALQHRDSLQEDITAELQFGQAMRGHKNVLSYDELWESQRKGIIYVVMPFAEFEDLFEVLRKRTYPFSEAEARWLFRQLLEGARFLHTKGIGFRDHSLENVLMFRHNDGKTVIPKITDPGQAVRFKFDSQGRVDELPAEKLFGKSFRPPEVYRDPKMYNPIKVDVFCLGWMLFFTVTKRQPFDRTLESDPHWKLLKEGRLTELLRMKGNVRLSQDMINLLQLMMCPDYRKRPDPKECLQHPWFSLEDCRVEESTLRGPPGPTRPAGAAATVSTAK